MKNKKVIVLVVVILLVLAAFSSILVYNIFGKKSSPETIVKDILNVSKYSTDISYTCKNSRGDFTEQGTLEYTKGQGAKINLGYVEQTFTDEKIKIHYFEDKEKGIVDKTYTVDRSYDEFYRYFMINELSKYLTGDSVVYKKGDGENKDIILVEFLTESKNVNIHKALLEVDSKKKVPKSLTIYDNKDKERIKVIYSNFKK